jgi:hypothetical protein
MNAYREEAIDILEGRHNGLGERYALGDLYALGSSASHVGTSRRIRTYE